MYRDISQFHLGLTKDADFILFVVFLWATPGEKYTKNIPKIRILTISKCFGRGLKRGEIGWENHE